MTGASHVLAFETRQENFTTLDTTQCNGHRMVSQAFQETPIHLIDLSQLRIGIRAIEVMPWFLSVLRVLIVHTPKHG
jgi:hypothetical protein